MTSTVTERARAPIIGLSLRACAIRLSRCRHGFFSTVFDLNVLCTRRPQQVRGRSRSLRRAAKPKNGSGDLLRPTKSPNRLVSQDVFHGVWFLSQHIRNHHRSPSRPSLIARRAGFFCCSDLPARSLTTTCGVVHSSRGMTLTVAERARAPIIGLRYGLPWYFAR